MHNRVCAVPRIAGNSAETGPRYLGVGRRERAVNVPSRAAAANTEPNNHSARPPGEAGSSGIVAVGGRVARPAARPAQGLVVLPGFGVAGR